MERSTLPGIFLLHLFPMPRPILPALSSPAATVVIRKAPAPHIILATTSMSGSLKAQCIQPNTGTEMCTENNFISRPRARVAISYPGFIGAEFVVVHTLLKYYSEITQFFQYIFSKLNKIFSHTNMLKMKTLCYFSIRSPSQLSFIVYSC